MTQKIALQGRPPAAAKPAAAGGQRLARLLLALFVLGVHLRLGVYSNGTLIVPMYLCLISGGVLILLYLREMLQTMFPAFTMLALLLLSLMMVSIFSGADAQDILRGTSQLAVSIVLMGTLIVVVRKQDARQLNRAMLLLWCMIAALTVAEIIAFRDYFASITDWLYSGTGRGIYVAEKRDLLRYGVVRPRALATEPSILAFTLNALASLCFMLKSDSHQGRAWLQFAAMMSVGYLLSPSLTVVFWVLAVFVWYFWPRTGAQTALAATGALIAVSVLIALLSFTEFGLSVMNRIDGLGTESGSLFGRLIVGRLVAEDALMISPIFGFGVGNEMGVASIIEHHWQSSGAFARSPWFFGLRPTDLQSNGFYWMWIELGIAGGLMFTYLVCRFMKAIGVRYPLRAVACGWIIWYSGGAFVDAASWFVMALFAFVPTPVPGQGRPSAAARRQPSRPHQA